MAMLIVRTGLPPGQAKRKPDPLISGLWSRLGAADDPGRRAEIEREIRRLSLARDLGYVLEEYEDVDRPHLISALARAMEAVA